jgi:hypothetical protein
MKSRRISMNIKRLLEDRTGFAGAVGETSEPGGAGSSRLARRSAPRRSAASAQGGRRVAKGQMTKVKCRRSRQIDVDDAPAGGRESGTEMVLRFHGQQPDLREVDAVEVE